MSQYENRISDLIDGGLIEEHETMNSLLYSLLTCQGYLTCSDYNLSKAQLIKKNKT